MIENTYRMTPDELAASRAVAWRVRSHRFFYKFMKAIAVFYVLLTLWQVVEGWRSPLWLFAAVLFLVMAFSIQRWSERLGRWSNRRHAGMDQSYAFALSDEGVRLEAGTRISGALPWDRFVKAVVDAEGILIYFDKLRFFWLPTHGFASSTDRRRAVELVRRRITVVHEVKSKGRG